MDLDGNFKWKILSLISLALLAALGGWILCHDEADTTMGAVGDQPILVIDPGHGGEDGGAVALDGTVESDINLAISKRLDSFLRLCGQETVLLREEDVSLHDPEAKTIREKKVSDIHNRVDTINGLTNCRLISIHQNFFPSSKYHGAHVFYAGGPLGQPWAAVTQKNIKAWLDPDNNREAAPVPHQVYLMNHITCPAILVECGFLSNPEEKGKLTDESYQTALAAAVGLSYLQYTKEGVTEDVTQGETSVLLHGVRQ